MYGSIDIFGGYAQEGRIKYNKRTSALSTNNDPALSTNNDPSLCCQQLEKSTREEFYRLKDPDKYADKPKRAKRQRHDHWARDVLEVGQKPEFPPPPPNSAEPVPQDFSTECKSLEDRLNTAITEC